MKFVKYIWTVLIYVWMVVYAIFGPLILAPVVGKAYFDKCGRDMVYFPVLVD